MKNFPVRSALWLLLSMLSALSMAHYVTAIWSVNQPTQFSDLYAPWWAGHELLLHRRNPYAPVVAHEIQTVIYGAPVTPSADDPAGIAGGFAYPPYAVLLLWPTIYLSFPVAQKILFFASVLVTLLALELWLRAFRFRPSAVQWFTIALFLLGSFPASQAIKLGNLSVVGVALIALALFLVSTNRLILAGVFLAASTFKPQFTLALIPWLALWALADFRRRRSLVWSFLATMLLLVLWSEWFIPGWISSFLNVVRAYRHYTFSHSLLDLWFTPTGGFVVSAILMAGAFALCWRYRSHPAGSPGFLLATSLLLSVNVVVIPTLAPHAQLLLLPGFLCLLRTPSTSGVTRSFTRTSQAAAWMLLAWTWIAASGLWFAGFRLPATALLRFWQVPLYTSPILPLALLIALGALLLANRGAVET
jgi:hypothetical protein